jgi:hypothetical protein
MRTSFASAVMIGVCGATLLLASSSVAAVNYNASKSNTVYFQDLSAKQQAALKAACAAHKGQIVTNDRGQLGCEVGSLDESKNISDGAAKGQANE